VSAFTLRTRLTALVPALILMAAGAGLAASGAFSAISSDAAGGPQAIGAQSGSNGGGGGGGNGNGTTQTPPGPLNTPGTPTEQVQQQTGQPDQGEILNEQLGGAPADEPVGQDEVLGGGGSGDAAAPTGGGGGGEALPFTGFLAIPLLVLGSALLLTGVVMRRRQAGTATS
jgi:hypothetical protein